LKDGGLVLNLNEEEVNELKNSLKRFTETKRLIVKNRTYEIDETFTLGKEMANLAENWDLFVKISPEDISGGSHESAETAFSNTATKYFNTKVYVGNDTDLVLTLLLLGLSLDDWKHHVKSSYLDGIPPDVNERILNRFEYRYGKMPEIIRLANPMLYQNRKGLMSAREPLKNPGERIEIDYLSPMYNQEYSDEITKQKKVRKISSHGGAVCARVAIDCYSGYTFGKLKNLTKLLIFW
jgi:hypothetical protein